MKPQPQLSKSRLMSQLQCPKRLYLEVHRRDLLESSDEAERAFAIGTQVGDVARELYGPGTLIAPDNDLAQALADTEAGMTNKAAFPLFEATFRHQGLLVRTDVLCRARGGFDLIEVKSSGDLKDVHIPDCAIQTWTLRGAGVPVRKTLLAHINKAFVYRGKGDYRGLLSEVDISAEVEALQSEVPKWLRSGRKTLAGDEPEIDMGKQCSDPDVPPKLSSSGV